MSKIRNTKIKNRKGSVLPLVLVVFMVLFILGMALLSLSLADAKQATWQNNRVQAHYLGRSGVHYGLELLDDELINPYTGDMLQLVQVLESKVSNPYEIPGVGTFTVDFEPGLYTGELRIISEGTTYGQISTSKTVTYSRELGNNYSYTNPAGEWLTGINLDKGINPLTLNKSFLGHAVMIESKNSKSTIQSPKGSSNPSTFQASVVVLRDYQGQSLRQITNSVDLTFDAELIFFNGYIELNTTNDDVILTISDDIMNQGTTDNYNVNYPNPTGTLGGTPGRSPAALDYNYPSDYSGYLYGFENFERYKAFIGDPSIDPGDYRNDDLLNFKSAIPYGIVKLGGGIIDSSGNTVLVKNTVKGYYYFPNGINLRSGTGDLIAIPDDDPIVARLDSFIGTVIGNNPPLWDEE
ncbi:MAG: hypothetical protein ACQEP4_00950 [Bacillota bacterium]